jgi:murein DD-endopeptidase MepM/ murein hydrolase activator NlpD
VASNAPSAHSSDRWPLARFLRLVAIVTILAVPAVAVTTVDATARDRTSSHVKSAENDDMNLMRLALNAERSERIRDGIGRATLSTAARERASRSLIRKALTVAKYVRPVPGPVTQWYGYHPGIDIAPPFGTPVSAAHSGVVTFVGPDDGYGLHVEVAQLDGYVTTYSHLSAFAVKVGQLVVAGQWVGAVGSTGWSTGPHLHFEVHLPGGARTDPAAWLRAHGVKV